MHLYLLDFDYRKKSVNSNSIANKTKQINQLLSLTAHFALAHSVYCRKDFERNCFCWLHSVEFRFLTIAVLLNFVLLQLAANASANIFHELLNEWLQISTNCLINDFKSTANDCALLLLISFSCLPFLRFCLFAMPYF